MKEEQDEEEEDQENGEQADEQETNEEEQSGDEEHEDQGDEDEDQEEQDEDDEEQEADEEDDEEQEADEEDDDEHEENKGREQTKIKHDKPSDVQLGKTLFIRNVSYETSEEDLKAALEQYGDIVYCVLTQDKKTGEPKGTGFVQFKTPDAAKLCLDSAYQSKLFKEQTKQFQRRRSKKFQRHRDDESDIVVDGRRLILTLAISRDDAEKNKYKKEKEAVKDRDKRNLTLADIGVIKRGTSEAESIPALELERRARAWDEKKKKLANPNFHVSKVRLSVRNIPKVITEKELRDLFLERARGAKEHFAPPIIQVKIVRDPNNLGSDGNPVSRGFGFVEFKHHHHAMAALKKISNVPGMFPKWKQPLMVEFAVDNIQKVKKREKRIVDVTQKQTRIRSLLEQSKRRVTEFIPRISLITNKNP